MLPFEIKRLTLDDFDRLQEKGFGNLLDSAFVGEKFKDVLFAAKLVYEIAFFESNPKPTLSDFLKSIQGADFAKLSSKLFEAYARFFQPRVAPTQTTTNKERDAKAYENRPTEKNKREVGANAPSYCRRSPGLTTPANSRFANWNSPQGRNDATNGIG